MEAASSTIRRSGILCSHCHKEIEGKVHQAGVHCYDSYCWYMRFVLDLEDEASKGKDARSKRPMENEKGA